MGTVEEIMNIEQQIEVEYGVWLVELPTSVLLSVRTGDTAPVSGSSKRVRPDHAVFFHTRGNGWIVWSGCIAHVDRIPRIVWAELASLLTVKLTLESLCFRLRALI